MKLLSYEQVKGAAPYQAIMLFGNGKINSSVMYMLIDDYITAQQT